MLSHWENNFATGSLSETQLKTTLGRYMASPVFRAFWERNRTFRQNMATAGDQGALKFHQLAEAAFSETAPQTNA
ncbi:DUF6082 family protein [Accumulibacter sp.]|uniref:DUF6082 family protein n=1 Tax=Accumulibacter sp. TaxID=2053492 RepID=UPI00338E48F1